MKIGFFDIDGVFNRFTDKVGDPDIDNTLVKLANQLVDANTRFVISSSWRYHHGVREFQREFEAAGFEGKIIDSTTCINTRLDGTTISRGDQILLWIETHREHIDSYVILDDFTTLGCPEVEDHWVKIDSSIGLTQANIDSAKLILDNNNGKENI